MDGTGDARVAAEDRIRVHRARDDAGRSRSRRRHDHRGVGPRHADRSVARHPGDRRPTSDLEALGTSPAKALPETVPCGDWQLDLPAVGEDVPADVAVAKVSEMTVPIPTGE
jgi:hypothetical protein